MSETPVERNRLDEEESPYLRQHADNPVNWQPWDEAALEAARERDVPIFLSVGYSACHWCHVMEEESFEDEEVAELLNEQFVPIKVDREERPDLDSIYQTVCQLVSGRGGWPLSVWLTPEGEPFYVGTYFPKESRRGMPGFVDLLENVAHSWENDREEIERRADQWTQAAKGQLEETPDRPGAVETEGLLVDAADAAVRGADREHGGFGSDGPKFPQPRRIEVLLRAYERTDEAAYREVALETLDAMADRGMYDHVGGGFHRYATDRRWIVPHFEKMLYDNAELPRAYLAGYQVTGDERYAEVAADTFAFVERELTHPEGGFYSTLDAQSEDPDTGEREEGAFYVWTPAEIREAIAEYADRADGAAGETDARNGAAGERPDEQADADADELAELFIDRYGVTGSGNFEGENVLTITESVESLAERYDLDETTVEERLERARRAVFEAREGRPRPRRDEKVLAGWNGLLISALAEGGLVLDERWSELAVDALAFVREHLWDGERSELARRYKDGSVKGDGYLEDYAFLARGAFDLYQVTGEVDHLAFAIELARAIEREFWDPDEETIYYTPESGESLVTRPQELHDQSTPSSLGAAVDVLLSLDHFAPHDRFGDVADAALETHGGRVAAGPLEHASLCLAADRRDAGALELTVAAAELPEAWRERLAETYLPGRILAPRPPTEDGLAEWLDALGLDEAPPIWAERDAIDGEPTLYTCRSFTCSPPVTDVDEALSWADDLAPDAA